MPIIDLSLPIQDSPEGVPAFQRVAIERTTNAQGGEDIEKNFGVPRGKLRLGEGWATETFTSLGTHSSTHVDAPLHYNSVIQGQPAQSIDELPLEWFIAPGVKLDFTHKADGDVITLAEVQAELARIGHTVQERDIVLMHTGRDAFARDADYWLRGPGVSAEATVWLYGQGVRVMGIDAWGWDAPLHLQAEAARESGAPGVFWAAHQVDLPYSQIERLCNLQALPSRGFTVSALPLRLVRGSAAPARVVAVL